MTSIEPTQGGINDICVFRGSGLMLLALDSSLIPSYFIPELGPAPKWCSPLENLTVNWKFFLSFYRFTIPVMSPLLQTRFLCLILFSGRVGGKCTDNYLW